MGKGATGVKPMGVRFHLRQSSSKRTRTQKGMLLLKTLFQPHKPWEGQEKFNPKIFPLLKEKASLGKKGQVLSRQIDLHPLPQTTRICCNADDPETHPLQR